MMVLRSKNFTRRKLPAAMLSAVLFMCAGFSGYAQENPQQDEEAHKLTVSASAVLNAMALGALDEESFTEFAVTVPDVQPQATPSDLAPDASDPVPNNSDSSQEDASSDPASDSSAPAQDASSDPASDSGAPAQDASSDPASDSGAPAQDASSDPASDSSAPAQDASSDPDVPVSPDKNAGTTYRYRLDNGIADVLTRVKLPYDSKLMLSQLANNLVGHRLVRFFDTVESGCSSCQALVTVNPTSEQVSVTAISADESKAHSFIIDILDDSGMPLRVENARQSELTADKRVLSGTLSDAGLPDGALVEVLTVTHKPVQDGTSSEPSSVAPESSSLAPDGSSSENTLSESIPSDRGDASGESDTGPAPNSSINPPKQIATADTSARPVEDEPIVPTRLAEPTAQPSAETPSGEPEKDASQDEPWSESSPASQEASAPESAAPQTPSSDSAGASSDLAESSCPPADGNSSEPVPPLDEQDTQTTILLLNKTEQQLQLAAFSGVALKVTAGFAAAQASTTPGVDPETITVTKTARPLDEEERTYSITLKAWAPVQTAPPADIVLVLDASGSMPWLMSAPAQTTTVTRLQNDQGQPDADSFSYYKYFVLVDNEYRPIEHLNRTPSGYSGSVSGRGWYRIESRSSGEKNIIQGALDANTTVYIKGEHDKTKLELLQESACEFVENVASSSPQSTAAVVSFNNSGKLLLGSTKLDSRGVTSVQSAINRMTLTGNTNHTAGLEQARSIINELKNVQGRSRYVIMFTDGKTVGSTQDEAKTVAKSIREGSRPANKNATIFTIGLYGGGLNPGDINGLQAFLTAIAGDASRYFNATSDGVQNVFNAIFANISNGLAGAVITDVINERFELVGTPDGAHVSYKDGKQTVTWSNQTIPASGENGGWSKTFTVKAKENYVGGNHVPTNGAGSQLTHPDYSGFSKAFTSPNVDVPLRYSLTARDGYLYAGDTLTADNATLATLNAGDNNNWQTYGDTTVTYALRAENDSSTLPERPNTDTGYRLAAAVTPTVQGAYPAKDFFSQPSTLHLLTPQITLSDTTVFFGEATDLNARAAAPQWQYRTQSSWSSTLPADWAYAGNASGKPTVRYTFKNKADGKPVENPSAAVLTQKTDFNVFAARDGVPDDYNFGKLARYYNNDKTPGSQDNDGWFTVKVITGSITVNKTINENWAPHGDPIFVFTLEKKDADGSYRPVTADYVRFTGGDSGIGNWRKGDNSNGTGTKGVTFQGLGAGTYRVTELSALRYGPGSVSSEKGTVSGQSVTFTLSGSNQTGAAAYTNLKQIHAWFSHTDVAKNSFTPNWVKEGT